MWTKSVFRDVQRRGNVTKSKYDLATPCLCSPGEDGIEEIQCKTTLTDGKAHSLRKRYVRTNGAEKITSEMREDLHYATAPWTTCFMVHVLPLYLFGSRTRLCVPRPLPDLAVYPSKLAVYVPEARGKYPTLVVGVFVTAGAAFEPCLEVVTRK